MTTNAPCAPSPCAPSPCATTIAERPRYFPRQLITPDDLMLEQEYFRNKMRRHNRMLHGWGVVCGAGVCVVSSSTGSGASTYEPWIVSVSSGYILGPYGDEIIIDCCRTVDLRTSGTSGIPGDPCPQPVDPWCTQVYTPRDPTKPLYIAVKYQECSTRPVRVQPLGCGCNDTQCEYSRLQDGYEIGVLTSCPESHPTPPSLDNLGKGSTPDCPPCPTDPWVVLAAVTVDPDGTIASIDNCQCRRLVMSFGSFWWECQSAQLTISGVQPVNANINLQAIPQSTKAVAMNVGLTAQPVMGKSPVLKADLGPGITVNSLQLGGGGAGPWVVNFDVAKNAAVGPRTLTITDDAGSEASLENAIKIVAAPSVPAPQAPGGQAAGGPGGAGGGPPASPAPHA